MNNEQPICPYCGTSHDIEENQSLELYDRDEGDHEIECESCDKKYTVSVIVEYKFSTEDQPDDEENE